MTREEALKIIREACRTDRQLAALDALGLRKPYSGNYKDDIFDPSEETTEEWEVDWKVTEDGTLLDQNGREYDIEAERLHEADWIRHMGGKGWVDMNTFLPAYLIACKKAGIDELTIKTGW